MDGFIKLAKLNTKFSFYSFILGSSVCLIHIIFINGFLSRSVDDLFTDYLSISLSILHSLLSYYFVIRVYCGSGETYQVSWRGWALGLLFGNSIVLLLSQSSYRLFGWYLAALAFFHWSEYFVTGITNPRNLTISSYILNHSIEYHAALIASFLEFSIEWYFLRDWKQPGVLSIVGLVVVLGGECLRKLAMYHAAENFNHYIRYKREAGHRLVTNGIFAFSRHPSYVGWFYWSIATQVMILNPVCVIAFAASSWKFFSVRVEEEEKTLIWFFGDEYLDYQSRVGTWLPFIHGYTYTGGWPLPTRQNGQPKAESSNGNRNDTIRLHEFVPGEKISQVNGNTVCKQRDCDGNHDGNTTQNRSGSVENGVAKNSSANKDD